MFELIRNYSRYMVGAIAVLIALAFLGGGLQGYSGFLGNDAVAKVAGQKITPAEWDAAHRRMADNLRQQSPNIDPALLDTPEVKEMALKALLKDYTLLAAASDLRLPVPDSRLARLFESESQFDSLRKADGSLDADALRARGMSPAQFDQQLRQQLTTGQVLGGVARTSLLPNAVQKLTMAAFLQSREVQWQRFESKNYLAQLTPTDDVLQAFYAKPAVAAKFKQPERVDVQYVLLDMDAIKAKVKVTEEDLRQSYKDNAASFSSKEERRASHILIASDSSEPKEKRQAAKQKAQALLVEVNANPARFADLAKANSQDPGSAANGGDLSFFERDAMVKPFADAAFSMAKGQISGVVESDFGYHIILLTDIRGGQVRPFEEVRVQLEDDARQQLAQRQYADLAEQFTNMVYEQSDSLKPVADALGLTVQTAAQVKRTPDSLTPRVLGNAKLLDALFDRDNISKQRNTEAIEVGTNQLIAARVVKHYQAAAPAFASVKEAVRQAWAQGEATRLAQADARAKMTLWQKDASQAGLPAPMVLSRRSTDVVPKAVIDAALQVPQAALPAWRVVDVGDAGAVLIKVNKVLPLEGGEPAEAAAMRSELQRYVSQLESDAYLKSLQTHYKMKILTQDKK
jgi:peptidyl-prolyl cis-trans isomerase D